MGDILARITGAVVGAAAKVPALDRNGRSAQPTNIPRTTALSVLRSGKTGTDILALITGAVVGAAAKVPALDRNGRSAQLTNTPRTTALSVLHLSSAPTLPTGKTGTDILAQITGAVVGAAAKVPAPDRNGRSAQLTKTPRTTAVLAHRGTQCMSEAGSLYGDTALALLEGHSGRRHARVMPLDRAQGDLEKRKVSGSGERTRRVEGSVRVGTL